VKETPLGHQSQKKTNRDTGLLSNVWRRRKEAVLAGLFLLPSLVIFAVFMFWPVIRTIYLSFFEWNMISPYKDFVGFEHYIDILVNPDTIKAFTNSAVYVVILLILNFVFPYLVSFVVANVITKGQDFYKAVIFFPSLVSLAVGSIVFSWVFNPVAGPMKLILDNFGISSPIWLKERGWVIMVLSLIVAWRSFGYNLIVLIGAVQDVPLELIEAARLEKASNWRIFWSIIRPMTSSKALYVFIITIVFGLQHVFTPINMLTQGGPNQASTNIVYIIYEYGFYFFQTGRAAALATITMIVFVGFIILQRQMEKGVHYEV
jgi:sn-glycerol 3-phosphate transport system permease protein